MGLNLIITPWPPFLNGRMLLILSQEWALDNGGDSLFDSMSKAIDEVALSLSLSILWKISASTR